MKNITNRRRAVLWASAFLFFLIAVNTRAQTGPFIIQDLTNQTTIAGSTVVLGVTVSGTGPFTYQWQLNGTNLPNIITTVAGTGYPPATNATPGVFRGIAVDTNGNLFVADSGYQRFLKISTNGIITTVAGGGTNLSDIGGLATNAAFANPNSVAVDTNGNLLILDSGSDHFALCRVAPNGTIALLLPNQFLVRPLYAVAIDPSNNILLAGDEYYDVITELGSNGLQTIVAGSTNTQLGDGGPATNCSLTPGGFAVDAYGNLIIADTGHHRIRKVGTNGIITTIAGNGISGTNGNGGAATNAELQEPENVAVDAMGNVFIADTGSYCVREVGTNGIINIVAGGGTDEVTNGGDGGPATNAYLILPYGVAVDNFGNLFISEEWPPRIRKVVFPGPQRVLANVSINNAGNYSVFVTDSSGNSVTSSVVSLTVLLPPQNFSATLNASSGVQFQFSGTPNYSYVLLTATSLAPPINWQPVITNSTDGAGLWTFTDTNALVTPFRFYRALLQPLFPFPN